MQHQAGGGGRRELTLEAPTRILARMRRCDDTTLLRTAGSILIPAPAGRRPSRKESPMNLVERVKHILLTPRSEWEVIDVEPATTAGLYTGYIMPLAAIGPIAQFIGYSLIGIRIPFGGGVYRTPIGRDHGRDRGLRADADRCLRAGAHHRRAGAVVRRDEEPDPGAQGGGLLGTAGWLAGIFALIPGLRILGILGLYSLYLLYLGLPVLMKAPKEKALGYTVVVIVAAVVLAMIVSMVVGRFMMMPVG